MLYDVKIKREIFIETKVDAKNNGDAYSVAEKMAFESLPEGCHVTNVTIALAQASDP